MSNQLNVALNSDLMSIEDIKLLMINITIAISSGKGSTPLMIKQLELDGSAPLRYFLGHHDKPFTHAQQKFVEAIWPITFKKRLSLIKNIWVETPNWRPKNPHTTNLDLKQSTLDIEFIKSFGVPLTIWDTQVFNSSSLICRVKKGISTHADLVRAYASLAIFGFLEPDMFFTANH